ncbi:MAG TPA: phosphate ABC transporter substrate-binding protein, partial [Pararobbsia sp.]|nr:phosphate ABC transporter substrate-binding protein [Pararobbsia sp.]
MYNVTPALRDHWRSLAGDTVSCLRDYGFHDPIVDAADMGADTDLDLDALWRRDDLLLSQTCGYPLMRSLP